MLPLKNQSTQTAFSFSHFNFDPHLFCLHVKHLHEAELVSNAHLEKPIHIHLLSLSLICSSCPIFVSWYYFTTLRVYSLFLSHITTILFYWIRKPRHHNLVN